MMTPPETHRFYSLKPLLFILLCLPFFVGCESNRTIVNALDEKEANEIIVFLSSKGIYSNKQKNTDAAAGGGQALLLWDIVVPEERATEAMSILNKAGLPRRRGQSLLGIFKNTGLVPTDLQEKIKYQAGLGEQIGSTIRKIDGVIDADVQISFPEEDPLNPGKTKENITASVYIKHTGVLDDPNTHLAPKIKRLVTASVPGLKYDNVTLVLDRARYSALPTSSLLTKGNAEKQYVSTWTLIIGKESLTRFRIIFFTLGAIVILVLLGGIWILWKLWPLLKSHGGIKELIHFHPIGAQQEQPKKQEKPKDEEENPFSGQEAPSDDEVEEYEGEPSDIDVEISEEEGNIPPRK